MSAYYHSFIHLLFIGLIALFPVINPIGSAFIVNHYFADLTRPERRKAVKKITLYAFCICTISLFAGHWILQLFGISIPVIQVAGGIMICKTGWDLLSDNQKPREMEDAVLQAKHASYESVQDQLFYPVTFPMTTGAGTISVLLTLGAHSDIGNLNSYLFKSAALFVAIIVMCFCVYFFYLNTSFLIKRMSSNGAQIFNRIMAFLIFCVGLQIAVEGVQELVKGSTS